VVSGAPPSVERRQVFVYYANETTPQQLRSQNYADVLAVLRTSANPRARDIARDIARDAERFPGFVERDKAALSAAARKIGFDLAIFTNELVASSHYLFVDGRSGSAERRRFSLGPEGGTAVLRGSPLARPEVFRSALMSVAAAYPQGSLDIVLVTSSHGSEEMALMPRVNTDLSVSGAPEDFARRLVSDEELPTPAWARLQGTDKIQFWNAVAEVALSRDVRFPLVVRAACGSGVTTWQEYRAVPGAVERLGHTDMQNLDLLHMDYAKLLAASPTGTGWIASFAAALPQAGLHVDAPRSLWWRPLVSSLQAIPLALYFAPIAGWLAWYLAAGFLKLRRRRIAPGS